MQLKAYTSYLGWSSGDLATKAGITRVTASRALSGKSIRPSTARKIAEVIGQALGENVNPGDIENLLTQGQTKEQQTEWNARFSRSALRT